MTALLVCACLLPAAAADRVKVDVALGEPASPTIPRLFGLSGNIWWTPESFGVGVAERILGTPHLGLLRLSLGDQVLQHATSLDDLRQRLAELPLNEFLRRYKAAGGQILLCLDGTPRWVSADKSTEIRKGPNLPAFRGSPPADEARWSEVVEAVVRHFNGKLGLNAYYEAWNEPNYYYYGSNEQFLRQYRATVIGARRADAHALVGGPAVSEVIGVTAGGEPTRSDADKLRITEQVMDHRYLFRQFLDYAAMTPVPELGLARLPVDFFSWHSYYADPSRQYGTVVPYLRSAIAAAGYPRSTPMFVSEWNIAPDLPYPEGDLNATEVGAAYAATSLIAMHEAGVDAQSYQMFVDPGVPGHYGGMFTSWGLPRASFQVFRLFAMLRGKPVRSRTSDPWVRSVACVDGNTVYLLVASMVPTPLMLKTSLPVLQNLDNAGFTSSVVRQGLVAAVVRGEPLPPPLARQAREIEARGEQSLRDDTARAAARKAGLTLEIEVGGLGTPRQVRRYLIDASHANMHPQLAKATGTLQAQQQHSDADPDRLRDRMIEAGVERRAAAGLLATLQKGKSLDQALGDVPEAQRAVVRRVMEQAVGQALVQRKRLLEEIENWPGSALLDEPVPWPAAGPLRLDIQPYTAVLYVIQR